MQLLHTMLRVGDLQRSIDFYTTTIGMDLLRHHRAPPDQNYTLAFVAFGGAATRMARRSSSSPTTTACPSMTSARPMGTLRSAWTTSPRRASGSARAGGNITREPGPVKGRERRSSPSWRTPTATRSS